MEHLIDIPGRLHSVAVEKHIAGTDQIYDDILKTTLDILNLENITDVKVQEGKLLFLNIQGLVLKEISITTEQKQSDWNLTDSTQIDFIKNKPIIYNKLEVDNKLITKQDIIDDIATIRSNAQAGATAYHKPLTGIPATDLASDVQSDLVNIVDIAQVIPEQASESNQLADKNFVNSSIATNTANYISDNGQPFQSLEHLEAYEGVLTNNDYAFIVGADSAGNTTYSRYKYNVSTHQWALEYILNNSSFTAEQWESISSGITSGLVTKLSALPTNSELTAMLNGKVGIAALNMYTKQVASEISNEEKYTGRHTITQTLHEVIYPNNNYRKTEMQPEWIRVIDGRGKNVKSIHMHFDDDYNPQIETLDDKVVWQNTATQQIPAATTEANGLMSADDKGKLNDLPTATELAQELGGKANSADLAEVATSGSYNDLSDKPIIPAAQVQSDWNEGDTTSKAYIKNKPTIPTVPTNVSAFNNDAGYITEDDVDDVPTAGSVNLVKSGGVYSTTPSITNTYAESDLDLADEDNNVLVRFAEGHIKTKNFDSRDVNILERASDSEMGNKGGITSVALTYNYISLLNSASDKDGKITKIEIKTEEAGNTIFAIAIWDETHGFIDIKEQFSLAVKSGINSLSINKNVPRGYQLFIIGGIKPTETNASKHIIAGNENIGDSDNNIIERQTSCYLAWNVHYDEVTVKQGFEMMSSDVNTISEEVAVCNDKVSKLNDTIDLTDEKNVRYKIKVVNGQLTLERLTIAYSKILVIAHSYGCILGGAWDRGMSSTKVSTDWVHQILNPLGVETLERVKGIVWEQNQGNPTAVLSTMLDSHLAVDDIDAVFIMLGANIPSQYRTTSIVTTNYSELINYINSRSSADIYVCSPGYTDETDPFNIAIRNAATSNGATYIETYWVNSEKYATMGDAIINASDDSYWFVNSAGRVNHPNDKWHLYMANKILEKLGHGGLDKVHNINVQAAQGKSYHCYSSWVAGGRCSIVIYDSVAPNISVQTINGESIVGVMVDLSNADIPSISPMPKFTYHFEMPNKDINITIN